jgi:hypothetical protein
MGTSLAVTDTVYAAADVFSTTAEGDVDDWTSGAGTATARDF